MNDRMPAGRPSNQDGEFSGRRCPVIVGPTAVGKTELITRLAAEHHIEVISLDSRQIYRGLRIGTAQPTQAELGICPHHLIDFVSPAEKYDAMRFRDDFEIAFAGICGRGGVPILVGGAGMYLTALQEGFLEIPGNNGGRLAAVRADLDRLSDAEILTRLTAVDPISAGRLHPNDRYRLQRALEIHQLSGRSMTELTAEQRPVPALGLRFPTFVLERPTPELDKRIAQRTEIMVSSGWIEETEAALGKHSADCPGLRSIGYREIVAMLKGELNLGEVPSAIVRVTRQYAKRQRTWFRKLDCLERGNP
ncbi:MAG: tRNA (adenosine(37)-N6)-dimethylallyltransferase MiaA, partial [Gemmatimonadales bacterium]|nr:tRNA (adenosine(37)-N6)-dimethylallyltransferase MiaA [Gemmatimonadales bacterium]